MALNVLILSIAAVLAGVIGFAAHRASLCSVRAVEELLTTQRGYMLVSFLKMALWVVGATHCCRPAGLICRNSATARSIRSHTATPSVLPP